MNGVVCIPRDKLRATLDLLPRLTAADDKVRVDILEHKRGLQEAFSEHRKGL